MSISRRRPSSTRLTNGRAVLVVLAVTTGSMFFATEQAGAATVKVPIYQHNICGNMCGQGSADPATSLVYFANVSPDKPWVISVNEVCYGQHQYLSSQLGPLGYTGFRTETKASTPCGSFGNSLFVLGTYVSGSGLAYQYSGQGSESEKRKMTCATMAGFLGNFAGCTTHLKNSTTTAQAQSDEGRTWVANSYGSVGRLVGGDFNLNAGTGWEASYWNADSVASNTFPSSGPNVRIDYTYGDKAHWPSNRLNTTPYCNSSGRLSDHCLVSGQFNLVF